MATPQAAPATTTAAVAGGQTSTTCETIVGWHVARFDGFSATKDLGVGKSIKSDTFRVGGHDWYIECYPCGDDVQSAGWVILILRRQDDHSAAYTDRACCKFTLMGSLKDGCFMRLVGHRSRRVTFEDDDTDSRCMFIQRKKLESLLKDDCFQVRCIVCVSSKEKFPEDLAAETISGSHVLKIQGCTKTRGAIGVGEDIYSGSFRIGRERWRIKFYLCGEDENDEDRGVATYLCLDSYPRDIDEVKVRFEMTLLTHAGKKISSIQDFYNFSDQNRCLCKFLSGMEHESSSLLQDGIQIRCDMAVVKGIAEVQPPPATDVTFEVGGHLFSAHKCVLTNRSTAFMAEFGKENAGVNQVLRIDGIEPRVFKALLHFIYTGEDALPEVHGEDKVVMAQGLLVAADRYAMGRLKLICADMLCGCIDATTAVGTKELAEKHGCRKLKAGLHQGHQGMARQGYSLITATEERKLKKACINFQLAKVTL